MNDQMTSRKILRLRKRAEFLSVRNGEKRRGPLILMEAKKRTSEESAKAKLTDEIRVGFTVTKKNGNAVIRNRIRRRLKEAVRCHAAGDMQPGTDYVIVARREALDAPFLKLAKEIAKRASRQGESGKPDRKRRTERPESGSVNGKKS